MIGYNSYVDTHYTGFLLEAGGDERAEFQMLWFLLGLRGGGGIQRVCTYHKLLFVLWDTT